MSQNTNLDYAKQQMMNAGLTLSEIQNRFDSDSDFQLGLSLHHTNIIHDCQRVIEIYVKSMFKIVDVNPPTTHSIDFDNNRTKGFLSADYPESFESADELPRAVFLTRFWEQFYTETKYGYPEKNLRPSDLFDLDDARRAISHAEFVESLAEEMKDAAEEDEDFQ